MIQLKMKCFMQKKIMEHFLIIKELEFQKKKFTKLFIWNWNHELKKKL